MARSPSSSRTSSAIRRTRAARRGSPSRTIPREPGRLGSPPRRPVPPVLPGGLLRGGVLPPDERPGGLPPRSRRANGGSYLGAEPSAWPQPPLRPPEDSNQEDRAVAHLPYAVRNELLLEELTMAFEAPTPAPVLYSTTPGTQASPGGGGGGPPRSIDRDPRSVSHCGSYGPSSAFHHLRCPSPTQGRTWGRRLLSWRFHRPGWRPELAVVLQPLDRHHLHVAGSSPQRLPSSGAGAALLTTPSYCTPTLPAYGMPSYDVPPTTPTPPALPPTGTPTPTPGSPFAGGWDPASFAAAYNTMALAPSSSDWVIDSGASYHVTPTTGMLSHSHPSPSTHPTLIVVGNSSTLPVTSVGASVLPGPFYLNYVLVAPHITHNLLSVCRFTTDNSCSIEFDPSGFSVKDLATRTPLHTPTHFHRRVSTSHPGHHLTSSSRPSRT
jgi:hypothetical protein